MIKDIKYSPKFQKIQALITPETKKRCKIFELNEELEKKFQSIHPETFHFLYEAESIDFPIYFRIEEIMIEFIKPNEFSKELLDILWAASYKSIRQLEICILKSDSLKFHTIIDNIRNKKIKKLLDADPNLDKKTIELFNNLSRVSQLIVQGGITKAVVNQVRTSAGFTVANLTNSINAISTLSRMISHDPTLYDHSASVALLSAIIGLHCLDKPLNNKEAQIITQAALYHDVGKTCVPSAILNKPAKLTPEEFEVMKTHTVLGAKELLKVIKQGAPIDPIAVRVAEEHHERMQGQGYPYGKKGRAEDNELEGIHLYTRIVMIADVYSALLMKRVYKPSYEPQDAIKLMSELAPKEYDMDIFKPFVQTVVKSLNEYQAIYKDKGRILYFDENGILRETKPWVA